MIIDAREDRMVVVSDLHLGSPASDAADRLPEFIDAVADGGWALCVNGDAIDLLQFSLPKLIADTAVVQRSLRDFAARGGRIYYTLGNHDLALEHLLADLPYTVAPLLNLRSGGRRIRIEHGHVYEPVFERAPGLYELGGRVGRFALLARADVYRWYSGAQQRFHALRRAVSETDYASYRAAAALFERGFDAAIFGHTHLPEITHRHGGLFVNSGDWMHNHTYVTVDGGDVELRRWPTDPVPSR